MKKNNFKVGDKVFAIDNPYWGLRPMKITHIGDYYSSCKHPEFSSQGTFDNNGLIPYSRKREKEVNQINKLEKQLQKLRKKLFKENS